MALLNPATRKFRYVELSSRNEQIWYSSTILGFGFLPQLDDYKVVEFQVLYGIGLAKIPIVVYTMSLDSWHYKRVNYPYGYLRLRNRSVAIKGFVHWVSDIIVWFDLREEVFGDMSVPDSCCFGDGIERELLERKGSLCMIVYTNRYEEMDRRCIKIWVMNEYGVEESWIRIFTIAPFSVEVKALGSWKNGGLIFRERFRGGDKIISYDPCTQEIEYFQVPENGMAWAFNYDETRELSIRREMEFHNLLTDNRYSRNRRPFAKIQHVM